MKIYSASNPTEAHIICEFLKAHDIACEVHGMDLFGLQGELPLGESTEPYIWLFDDNHHDQAIKIIEQFRQRSTHSDWCCSYCGEDNGAQFDLCWNCGANANRWLISK